MRSVRSHFAHVVALLSAAAVCGCADLSKASIKRNLDEDFQKGPGVCSTFVHPEAVTFPLTVDELSLIDVTGTGNAAILKGLEAGHFITTRRHMEGFTMVVEISLTPAGKDAGVWDPKHGFCIGRKRVTEVVRYTEPAPQAGALVTRIEYRWQVADRPAWATEALFRHVPGVAAPVDALAVGEKTSDGWLIRRVLD